LLKYVQHISNQQVATFLLISLGEANLETDLPLIKYKNYKFIKLNEFTIYYNNEESAKQTIEEVFNNKCYQFKTTKRVPVIIDAGSNIGIATLFFKATYPEAKIICFEPDPNTFEILKINVHVNHLKDITLINAAVSCIDGEVDFYGQIDVNEPDTRGNSIINLWGQQRDICNEIKINSVKLSSYINDEIDFLKLDIEGAEEQVLSELSDKIKFCKSMAIEFHESEQLNYINNINRIEKILKQHKFDYKIISADTSVFPEAVKGWVNKMKPHLYIIKAIQRL
jgi:FkbM family methyltransferase